jgi:hypothetical protein
LARLFSHFVPIKPIRWIRCLSELNICRLDKQLHRASLTNICVKAITDVGLEEASPTHH